jgi:polar amino acid transport system substrate-binding protein
MKHLFKFILLPMVVVLLTACVQTVTPTPAAPAGGQPAAAEEQQDDLLAEILNRGSIRISTDPNYAPQSFLNEQGQFVGFDVDVAREIAERLGVEADFVTPDWDLITAGNWGGQWDMSVGSMAVTTARSQVLDFAEPAYYYTPAQFAATIASGIDSLDQLDGQAICVGISTTYEVWLEGDLEALGLPESSYYHEPPQDVSIIPLQSDNDCAQQIQAGRSEYVAFLTSNTVVEAAIREGVAVQKVNGPVFSENLSAAFDKATPKSNARLVERVGEIIQEMHNDGTLSNLSIEWFGEDLSQDPTQ